jgi:DNA polymerase-3 subunit alpha/error-prone DNA polymerase
MQIMMAVADFTPGEADQMRRILSNAWRKPSQIEGLRKRIEAGLFKNGVTPQDIEQIFKTIEGFASYGFPESHAASFALITYVSSYLKCHHHDVFTCALLNSQPMGFYPPRVLIQDAQKHGVKFLPLCVQHSDWDYTLEREPPKNTPWLSVREGFRALRGIKKELALRLIENRKNFGHFADFFDLIKRLKLSKQETQFLIRSGTLKCFHTDSAQLLWQLGKIDFHHDSLFWFRPIPSPHSTLDLEDSVATPIENEWEVKLPKKSDGQKLKESYLVKGYDLESHPLKLYRSELRKKGFLSSQELLRFSNPHHGKPVRVAGMVSLKQRPPTAKGVSFLTLEDEFGLMNIVLMPPIYERYRVLLEQASFLSVFGELEVKDSIRHIRAKQLHPFSS